MQSRKQDNDKNGYAKRRFFDLKTIILLTTVVGSTGGTTGLVSYLTDPNIVVQEKVDRVVVVAQKHELKLTTLGSEVKLKSMRMENYITAHAEEVKLSQKF